VSAAPTRSENWLRTPRSRERHGLFPGDEPQQAAPRARRESSPRRSRVTARPRTSSSAARPGAHPGVEPARRTASTPRAKVPPRAQRAGSQPSGINRVRARSATRALQPRREHGDRRGMPNAVPGAAPTRFHNRVRSRKRSMSSVTHRGSLLGLWPSNRPIVRKPSFRCVTRSGMRALLSFLRNVRRRLPPTHHSPLTLVSQGSRPLSYWPARTLFFHGAAPPPAASAGSTKIAIPIAVPRSSRCRRDGRA